MAMDESVFTVGQTMAGMRRGPMTTSVSSGKHMNFRKADSWEAAGVLNTGGVLGALSVTDLRPLEGLVLLVFVFSYFRQRKNGIIYRNKHTIL